MRRTALTLLCLSVFLLSFRATHATTGDILTNLRKQLFSLHLQGAPVPEELLEMFERREDLPDGEMREPSLTEEERWQHVQTYLASLTAHAEDIAPLSPLAAEDIRALAMGLLSTMETMKERRRSAFLEKLKKAYREIFPEEEGHSISTRLSVGQFREEGEKLLTEIPDLLALLTLAAGSQTITPLLEETKKLQAALPYLTDGSDLVLFIHRFDVLTETILSLSSPPPLSLLQEDLQELLATLDTYLTEVEQSGIVTERGKLTELQEELSTIQTEETLGTFLTDLEELLTRLPQKVVLSPQAP